MSESYVIAQLQSENQRLNAEVAALRQEREQNYTYSFSSKEQALLHDAIERERLLQTITTVANQLLRAADYTTTLPEVLRSLGEVAFSDRCYLVENLTDPHTEKLALRIHTEWCRAGIGKSIDITPELAKCASWDNFPGVQERLIQGEMVTLWINELPEPSFWEFKKQGIMAMTLVPILVQEKFWGVFGFDYCTTVPSFDAARQAIFTIAVGSIAAAIERQAKNAELRLKEQAAFEAQQEKAVRLASMNEALLSRERLLETVATAANALLTIDNFDDAVNSALQIIGESLDTDRVMVIDHFDSSQGFTEWRLLYEWDSFGTISQISHPTLARGSNEEIKASNELLSQGDTESCLLEDMPEPFRSGQAELGVKCSHVIPIFVEGKFWGSVGFDDCREAKHRSTAELAVFKTAANCIGSAIERKRTTQALLQAEQQRTQELERHNIELQHTLLRLTESEERYRNLMELSSEGIYRFEYAQPISISLPLSKQVEQVYQQFRVVEHNQAYAQMYGYDQSNAMVGARLTNMHIMEAPENVLQMQQYVSSGHKMRNQETVEIDCFEQKHYYFNNAFSIIRDGYAIGGWGTQIDITQLRQRDRLIEVVAKITKDLLSTEDIDVAIPAALKAVGDAANISRVLLLFEQLDASTGCRKHYVAYEWTATGITNHESVGLSILDNEDFEVFNKALYQGQSIWRLIDDLPDVTKVHFEKLGIKSTGVVPIFIEGRYIGSVGFDDCITYRTWTQQEIDVLTAAADSIGAALHRKLLVKRLVEERLKAEQERVAQLATANIALKKTLDVLATEPELDKSLGHVLQVTTEHLGSSSAALWLYNQNTNTFAINLVYLDGNIIAATPENAHLLTNQWIRGRDLSRDLILKDHIHSRVPVLYDVLESPKLSVGQRQFFRNLGVQALLGVPLLLGSEIVGSFTVRFNEKRLLQAEELELTQALAHQATLAIQLLQMAEEAKINVLLEERNRMAGEIHDTLAQGFTGIITYLEAGSRAGANQNFVKVQSCIDNALQTARSSLQEARRSVWALRPQALEQADLSIALHSWVEHLRSCTNIEINTQGEPRDLSPEVDRELLRIATEAVVNALKHAQAPKITLDLIWQEAYLTLRISDNGQGFVLQRTLNRGFGLISMQQRASRIGGELVICSDVGQGAQISVTIPINANPIIEVKP